MSILASAIGATRGRVMNPGDRSHKLCTEHGQFDMIIKIVHAGAPLHGDYHERMCETQVGGRAALLGLQQKLTTAVKNGRRAGFLTVAAVTPPMTQHVTVLLFIDDLVSPAQTVYHQREALWTSRSSEVITPTGC